MPDAKGISRTYSVTKITWIALCVLVLLVSYYFGAQERHGKHELSTAILVWGMLVLSFPGGWLVLYLVVGVGYLLALVFDRETTMPELYDFIIFPLLLWLAYFVVGYLQWFKLVPALVTKVKHRKNTG